MKLRNKQTGEIVDVESITSITPTHKADKNVIQLTGDSEEGYRMIDRVKNLSELCSKWEDYEEPEESMKLVITFDHIRSDIAEALRDAIKHENYKAVAQTIDICEADGMKLIKE